MHNYLPSLKQMQYLVALHEHGHFGRAADGCNVTQSTLSAGIRELETLLGQTLVERTRPMKLALAPCPPASCRSSSVAMSIAAGWTATRIIRRSPAETARPRVPR